MLQAVWANNKPLVYLQKKTIESPKKFKINCPTINATVKTTTTLMQTCRAWWLRRVGVLSPVRV